MRIPVYTLLIALSRSKYNKLKSHPIDLLGVVILIDL